MSQAAKPAAQAQGQQPTAHAQAQPPPQAQQPAQAQPPPDPEAERRKAVHETLLRAEQALQAKRYNEAVGICQDVLETNPDHPPALALLGAILGHRGDLARGASFLERAIGKDANVPAWHSNLSGLYRMQYRVHEAVSAAQRAVQLRPDLARFHVNLGKALVDAGDRDAALTAFLTALGREATNAEAHLAIGQILLARGDTTPGWLEYEWRNQLDMAKGMLPKMVSAQWNGMRLPNDRILLVGDQGYGDTLQFCRFIPMVAERCQEVLLGCSPDLAPLLRKIPGIKETYTRWNEIPRHIAYCLLSSLPHLFGVQADTIPADVPYLSPEPEQVQAWAERLAAESSGREAARRHRLVGAADAPERPAPLHAARGSGAARAGRGRRFRLADAKNPPARRGRPRGAARAGGHLRRVDEFCRNRGGDLQSRPGDHHRHGRRASHGNPGPAGLADAGEPLGLALDARSRRYALVPDHAPVPPATPRRLAERGRRGRAGARADTASERQAQISSTDGGRVMIACLHTVESLIPVFDAEARKLGVTLRHRLRDDLLREAEREGGLTDDIAARTAADLDQLAEGAEAVLLTCSTLGPSVTRARASVPVLRVDEALAEAAVRGGGRVVVLCAVETTMEPSRALFEHHARLTGARVEVRLAPGAWAAFRDGDRTRYAELIATAADAAYAEGADVVALAQASMAGAAALARNGTPLTSPAIGLAAAQHAGLR